MTNEIRRHVSPMIKAAFVMMILGFINALIAFGITWHLNAQRPFDRGGLEVWDRIWIWIWPSGIMMMALESSSSVIFTFIGVLISAVFNGFIYGIVGLAAGAVWQKLKEAGK